MRVVDSIPAIRALVSEARKTGSTIGLVPTMGALHAGHRRLVEVARGECGFVVVTIFVNPTQFNQASDFEKYPRTLEADLAVCAEAGADVIFAPSAHEMYPGPQYTTVEVSTLGEHLCGKFRPGHFRGVATVVSKLLNIAQADRAYFGEKDAQQLAIIQRMVADLDMAVRIVPVPTVREADGLAMSSRNVRLSAEERAAAPAVYRALQMVAVELTAGRTNVEEAKQAALAMLAAVRPQPKVEYLDIVDMVTLAPLAHVDREALIAIAVWMGDVRLIDNLRYAPARA